MEEFAITPHPNFQPPHPGLHDLKLFCQIFYGPGNRRNHQWQRIPALFELDVTASN
jgi:hypothetical protein